VRGAEASVLTRLAILERRLGREDEARAIAEQSAQRAARRETAQEAHALTMLAVLAA
jgi:hypothetical protein